MNKQVFYDPQRKRWKRLRRIFDVLALLGLLLGLIFVIGLAADEAAAGVAAGDSEAELQGAFGASTAAAAGGTEAGPLCPPAHGPEAVGRSVELGRRIAGGVLRGL